MAGRSKALTEMDLLKSLTTVTPVTSLATKRHKRSWQSRRPTLREVRKRRSASVVARRN
jgi:hypothetical protein